MPIQFHTSCDDYKNQETTKACFLKSWRLFRKWLLFPLIEPKSVFFAAKFFYSHPYSDTQSNASEYCIYPICSCKSHKGSFLDLDFINMLQVTH